MKTDGPGSIAPCGDTVTYYHDRTVDEGSHDVVMVHRRVAYAAFNGLIAVHNLHRPSIEDFAPYCPVCHMPAPCPTRQETTRAMETQP